MAYSPVPTVTPYLSPSQGGNKNVPVGQTGTPYSSAFIGPIPYQYAPSGAPVSSVNFNQPTMQSTQYQTPNPTPAPTPSQAPQGQGFVNVGTISGNQRWNGVQWEPLGGSNGANDETARLLAEIDKAYSGGMDVLNAQEARLAPENEADISNLTSKIGLQTDKATQEGTQLTSDTADAENKQYTAIESALQSAIRAFNSLNQQRMARYGMGSSTGGAVGELSAQEFYRQQGGLNEQKVDVGTQFAKEFTKIKLFTKGKIDELEQYKNESITALKKDLADRLNTIAVAKADIGNNKAQMRLSAIQDTISSAREIANQATTFRQTLAANALNNMQQVAGRAFTPAEIKATLNDYGITSFGTIGSNTPVQNVNPNYYGKTATEDPLKDLFG